MKLNGLNVSTFYQMNTLITMRPGAGGTAALGCSPGDMCPGRGRPTRLLESPFTCFADSNKDNVWQQPNPQA